ncbi:phenylalanine--tRNA ligase subunit beta [Candidatus Saccharibacteria bacterium]|nr:phenylalanine--tRNA ligase subunit beta [Candidatus Saccharibacteria bacterium]
MKISLNWIKKFVKIAIPDEELIRLIGARLVEVEGVIDETHKYDHIYIVRVEKAEKIPDTHLTKCMINVGDEKIAHVEYEDGLVQVMCGAPNVREGMLAVWIAPGAIVPASVHEDAPFVIGKRKMLKKYDSYGMLAGADELDFGEDHSGIVEIDPTQTMPDSEMVVRPGDKLADLFELNDKVLDIENKSLTHRPDTFGIIGFAREVAGILGIQFSENQNDIFSTRSPRPIVMGEASLGVLPLSHNGLKNANSGSLKIDIQNPDICPRYSAIVLEKHGEMKDKYLTMVDTRLAKAGMHPINKIVDATNYLMLLTGQPLHAFDYDKFVAVGGGEKPEIKVRLAREGEKIVLLDDKEVELNNDDIVICSGDNPVAIAGAMGGKSTEIDADTKNIIIESATFSLYHLRKTQMAHGIFSEAITRFTKGQPSYQTLAVAEECARMLSDGYKVAEVADDYLAEPKEIVVKVTKAEINNLLGTNYETEKIVKTLTNVGFQVKEESASKIAEKDDVMLIVTAPEWRTDIHIKEDIIEEVGRLNGYDNILPTLPLHATAEMNSEFCLKREVRDLFSKYGANELLTYSFVSEKLLEKAGQDATNSYRIINSISPELQYVRQSVVPSLLEKAYMNEKLPVEKMAMFEMNKVYQKSWGVNEEQVPVERTHLGLVIAERKNNETAYYKAKKYVDGLMDYLNISVIYLPLRVDIAETRMLEPKRAAEIRNSETDEIIGVVGELKNSVKHEFKLGDYTAVAEIDIEKLMKYRNTHEEIKIGQVKTMDETIETDMTYEETLKEIKEKYPEAEIEPMSIYQAPGRKEKNISFHITFKK